jgi:curli biogenesis system outer membrane secretion channel CsgG
MRSTQIIDMNLLRPITVALCIFLCGHAYAQVPDMDTELSNLSGKLATQVNDHSKKKVAVLDFTDLQGGSSELGKYIAEQLTVNLVMGKRDFSVLDRANLKSILAEHKLTATGLVDPENAKKLGMFAGVDALILGTIIPKGTNTTLNAKIITTDTAEIVGAARAEFMTDNNVQQLMSRPVTEVAAVDDAQSATKETPILVRSFDNIRVEVHSLTIVNGSEYLLTLNFVNESKNANSTSWILLSGTPWVLGTPVNSTVFDPDGYEFHATAHDVAGIGVGSVERNWPGGAPAQIKSSETVTATIKFSSRPGRTASPGNCRIQVDMFFLTRDGYGDTVGSTPQSLVGEIKVN